MTGTQIIRIPCEWCKQEADCRFYGTPGMGDAQNGMWMCEICPPLFIAEAEAACKRLEQALGKDDSDPRPRED